MEITLTTPLTDFPGVGPARAKRLEKLGLATAGDLVRFFPRDDEDRRAYSGISDAPADTPVCVRALLLTRPRVSYIRKGLELVKAEAGDDGARMKVTWFNQSWLRDGLRVGEEYVFFGKVEGFGRGRQMTTPVVEPAGRDAVTGRILPVYPLTAGISNNLLASLVRQAVEACADQIPEALPASVLKEWNLAQSAFSYRAVHLPDSFELLELARRRLVFEELFYLSAGLALLRHRRSGAPGRRCACPSLAPFLALLPFAPTGAQARVMEDCRADMTSGRPMNRLVQGDVGSGKTAVAAAAGWIAARSGLQTAMMAPTEILARQHYQSLSALLGPAGIRVGLLTGSMTAAQKRETARRLAAGEIDFAVGTHALLTAGVEFRDLGLVVADEQHRFGVEQRSALAAKGKRPHVLVMSATPIPRTLALIVYGDLDVSVIDQLPPGRTPVVTGVRGEEKRQELYAFIRRLAAQGRQTFIVCPAVEESAAADPSGARLPDLKAVTTYEKELRERVFPDLRVGLVHGKLKAKEKQAVMAAFAAGELDVLVATTVVEVGVDVPNAALMVVEDAQRFGLSKLHQLRGRVGRGKHRSYCVLMSHDQTPAARERLAVMTETNDGFAIARKDLELRGPGDFFGDPQLGQARRAAEEVLDADPRLEKPEHRAMREKIRELFADQAGIFN